MRHGNKVKKLGRSSSHRAATLASLSTALITHKRITTTLARAKALRVYVEPVINRAKDDSTASRRQAFRRLRDKEAVKELFGDVAGKIDARSGGYTRIVKLGPRFSDGAEMAIIELVDYNDVKPDGASKKSRRTRRGSGRKKSDAPAAAAPQPKAAAPAPAAAPAVEAAPAADDLTKIWGVGPVFAKALVAKGLTTFAQVADADVETLRAAIADGSSASDTAANEETWAEQARLLAAGDEAGFNAYVEQLKAA